MSPRLLLTGGFHCVRHSGAAAYTHNIDYVISLTVPARRAKPTMAGWKMLPSRQSDRRGRLSYHTRARAWAQAISSGS